MKIHRSLVVLVTLASALECAAIIFAVAMDRVEWLPLALFMHLLAAYLSSRAASVRRDDLSDTERDAVLWVAALVPMFGPSLAWSMAGAPPPPPPARGVAPGRGATAWRARRGSDRARGSRRARRWTTACRSRS